MPRQHRGFAPLPTAMALNKRGAAGNPEIEVRRTRLIGSRRRGRTRRAAHRLGLRIPPRPVAGGHPRGTRSAPAVVAQPNQTSSHRRVVDASTTEPDCLYAGSCEKSASGAGFSHNCWWSYRVIRRGGRGRGRFWWRRGRGRRRGGSRSPTPTERRSTPRRRRRVTRRREGSSWRASATSVDRTALRAARRRRCHRTRAASPATRSRVAIGGAVKPSERSTARSRRRRRTVVTSACATVAAASSPKKTPSANGSERNLPRSMTDVGRTACST